jgi:hypothetical protein
VDESGAVLAFPFGGFRAEFPGDFGEWIWRGLRDFSQNLWIIKIEGSVFGGGRFRAGWRREIGHADLRWFSAAFGSSEFSRFSGVLVSLVFRKCSGIRGGKFEKRPDIGAAEARIVQWLGTRDFGLESLDFGALWVRRKGVETDQPDA